MVFVLFKIRCCQGTFFDGTVATSDDRCYWLYGTYGEEVRIWICIDSPVLLWPHPLSL